jgi:hypothetical protein
MLFLRSKLTASGLDIEMVKRLIHQRKTFSQIASTPRGVGELHHREPPHPGSVAGNDPFTMT